MFRFLKKAKNRLFELLRVFKNLKTKVFKTPLDSPGWSPAPLVGGVPDPLTNTPLLVGYMSNFIAVGQTVYVRPYGHPSEQLGSLGPAFQGQSGSSELTRIDIGHP